MAKIGINGFGRIGRLILRAVMEKATNRCSVPPLTQVVCINDCYLSAAHMAYLFTYDSNYGKYPGTVTTMGNCIMVDGQRIETFSESKTEKIQWNKNCADYVVDATGNNDTKDKASLHLKGGAKRVIVTGTSKDMPMFVVGVNHECYDTKMTVISCTNCTTNALATLAKVINDNFQIELGTMTAIHSVTASQRTVDMGTKCFRLGRGALQNIIPTKTCAVDALPRILPELDGKITGLEIRVPVPTVSLIDLSLKLTKQTPMNVLKCKIKQASDTYMKGILGSSDEPLVSSDIIGDSRSCIFDAGASVAVDKCFIKVIGWYDNEYAYAYRVVEMLNYMHSREANA